MGVAYRYRKHDFGGVYRNDVARTDFLLGWFLEFRNRRWWSQPFERRLRFLSRSLFRFRRGALLRSALGVGNRQQERSTSKKQKDAIYSHKFSSVVTCLRPWRPSLLPGSCRSRGVCAIHPTSQAPS